MRTVSKLETPEGPDRETLVSTIDIEEGIYSTKHSRPVEIKGGLKALQEKGIRITPYNEENPR